MAKLPDHIDKTDKQAVAEYFIKQRQLKGFTDEIQRHIDEEGTGSTIIIGQPRQEFLDHLVEQGYTVKVDGHITWRIWPPPKPEEEPECQSETITQSNQ
jgi:hypothetical protein